MNIANFGQLATLKVQNLNLANYYDIISPSNNIRVLLYSVL